MTNIVRSIRKTALEVVQDTYPVCVLYGTIMSAEPLDVFIEQKFSLSEEFFVKNGVFKGLTEDDVGKKLILIRLQGGQQFLMLEKLED